MFRTEKEQLKKHRQTLHLIDQRLSGVGSSVNEMIDHFKVLFYSNKSSDISFRSMNKHCAGFFERSQEELIAMGTEFHAQFIHPESVKTLVPQLTRFYQANDTGKTFAFVQKLRGPKIKGYKDFITITKVDKSQDSFLTLSISVDEFSDTLTELFHELKRPMDEPFLQHFQQLNTLTQSERKILKLIGNGLTSRQVAEQLNISKLTVDTHRKHVRKKLNLKTNADLIKLAVKLEITD